MTSGSGPERARYIPDQLVSLSFPEAAHVLGGAMAAYLGEEPTREALALGLAKTGLETGRWGAKGGLHSWNFGNVKQSLTREGLYTCFTLNEVLVEGGRHVVVWFAPEGRLVRKGGPLAEEARAVPPGHPQTRMRAFNTAPDGALDYVKFVGGGRYADAWQLLLRGDAPGYVRALKAKNYFTADEAEYLRGVASMQREFIRKLAELPPEEPEYDVPPPEVVREWLSPQDIDLLEAAFAARVPQILEETKAAALASFKGDYDADGRYIGEQSGGGSEPPKSIA